MSGSPALHLDIESLAFNSRSQSFKIACWSHIAPTNLVDAPRSTKLRTSSSLCSQEHSVPLLPTRALLRALRLSQWFLSALGTAGSHSGCLLSHSMVRSR